MSVVVEIGSRTVTLRAPRDTYLCWEVAAYAQNNALRGGMAALGVCWSEASPGMPKASYRGCGSNPATYGAAVANELLGKAAPAGDLVAAGQAALGLLLQCVPTGAEVADEEAFFRPVATPPALPANASLSSENGGRSPGGSRPSRRASRHD